MPTRRAGSAGRPRETEPVPPAPPASKKTRVSDEVVRAAKICARAGGSRRLDVPGPRMGKAIEAAARWSKISNSVMRNPAP